MILELMDWEGKKTQHDIGELDDILAINIEVISGDEIACVTYKDGCTERFDSSNDRLADFYDGQYPLYNLGCDYIFSDQWKNRTSSYDCF